jgi:hypothetical protein
MVVIITLLVMGQTLLFLVLLRLMAEVVAVVAVAPTRDRVVVLVVVALHKIPVPVFRVDQVVRVVPAVKAAEPIDSPAALAVVGEQRVEQHRGLLRVTVAVVALHL